MYRLIESIRVENQKLQHIDYHNRRFNAAICELFGISELFRLEDFIHLPDNLTENRYKLRITFDGNTFQQDLSRYEQRIIRTLKMVEENDIDYRYKTENREALTHAFAQRGECDDVIIVKGNCLTDSSFANIILFDGDEWFTPDTPLLMGIMRAYLLEKGFIKEARITADMVSRFHQIKLINAMIDFERASTIVTRNIIAL